MVTKKLLATALSAIISYGACNGVLAASVRLAAGDLASPSKTLLTNGLSGQGGRLASALSLSSQQKSSLETALAEIRMKTPTRAEVSQEHYIEGQIKARLEAEKLLEATLTGKQKSLLNMLQQKSGVKSLSSTLSNIKAANTSNNCAEGQELQVEETDTQVITVYYEEPDVQEITVYYEEPDVQEITVYLTPVNESERKAAVDRGKIASPVSTAASADKAAGAGAAADRGKVAATSASAEDKAAASAAADRGKVATTSATAASAGDKAAASAVADRGKAAATSATAASAGDKAAASAAADRGKAAATSATAASAGDKAAASAVADRGKVASTSTAASKAQSALQAAVKK